MTSATVKPSRVRISRRTFMRKAGIGVTAAAASLLAAPPSRAAAAESAATEDARGVLIDLTRCTGCKSCALACKSTNRLPNPEQPGETLDRGSYSFVDERQVQSKDGQPQAMYVKRQCMHCLHPACASACTVGALRKTAAGPVVYDAGKCIGCRYCQYACPFGVPAYEWDNPLGLIAKCQFCVGRQRQGERPACVAACPNGALRFGSRSNLLREAHGRLASNPERYVQHVYGEFEAGGTSMLYLSPIPFTELGFPDLASEPAPHNAEAVMERTPWIALSVASLATMLHLILKRREDVAAFTVAEHKPIEKPDHQAGGKS